MANAPVKHLQETGKSWLQRPDASLPYAHNEYPKRVFHKDKDSVVVQTPEELTKLGAGWAETPAAFDAPEPDEAETETLVPEVPEVPAHFVKSSKK